ncbi:MAG TPA: tRNA uridine-5-carboxymethylaminomethyl(34) synthesis GTPase MnmE [Blastocatellia bacterium]|nr:tRNA uridine-5-carboxymethylaminomethyl(34) synthesis GTPase MnmE [Blastocatellia bacterium]
MYQDETIAAISTPPGRGGIGVVRLSGFRSLEIAATIFRPQSNASLDRPNRAQFGSLIDAPTGELIDEAVVTYFKAPQSYTGEDTIEISCHGSPVILSRVLEMITSLGARIAEPGEFTFRAFLNRRIDLAQAQAVRDIISAQTRYQARVATRQLEGALSNRLAPARDSLVEIIVHLESTVEFVEDDISPATLAALAAKLDKTIAGLEEVAASFSFGRYVKEGFDLAIVGRPNVGKSSVFNRLVGSPRAIVTEIAGTTRDALYESASIAGVPVRLIDTAGIRETADPVESIGIVRSRSAIADADISLVVLDASEPMTDDDVRLLEIVPEDRRILALNKTDLPRRLAPAALSESGEPLSISALMGEGFDELTKTILGRLSGEASVERDDLMITDARQHAALRRSVEQASEARDLIIEGELEEIILLKLHGSLSSLGEITGETLTEDILGQIFSTFCIGK